MSIKKLLSVLMLSGVSLGATLGTTNTADAQLFSRGDLFGPGALPPMFSIEAGFGQHVQGGTFDCDCGVTFSGQSANGFLANLMYELPLDYSWVIGLKGGIDFKGLKGSQLKNEDLVVTFADRGDSLTIREGMSVERTDVVDLTYVGFTPFIKYQFSRVGPFVQMGPNIQFLVSSHILHRRELIAPYTIDRGKPGEPDLVPIKFNNGERFEILQDEELTTANGTRISLQVTGGWDFELSEHSLISPMITYELPFTTVRDDLADNWKITSLYGSVAMKFRLN
jgi:hypothetical protein